MDVLPEHSRADTPAGTVLGAPPSEQARSPARWRIRLSGLVQGVGFRPFVQRLAIDGGISGWVRNDPQGLSIEAEARGDRLDAFVDALARQAPPAARIDRVTVEALPPRGAAGDAGFVIAPSAPGEGCDGGASGPGGTAIAPDTAVCDACLAELFDPANRRWRYPFIGCAQCGARFTLTRAMPYDRARTSMTGFEPCARCAREYRDPRDRRLHAEANACAECGPRLRFLDTGGQPAEGDPVAHTLSALRAGRIVAIKGLGGYHLACDARDAEAVARLRARKAREAKPLAVMALNAASLDAVAHLDGAARRLLESAARPIVLLDKRRDCDGSLAGVAPGLAWLGAMLPYAPVHYLLFHEALGRPHGTGWLACACPLLLVMTSANLHGEPLLRDDREALERLAGIADAWLAHDRDIVVRCDDSVAAVAADGSPRLLRRGRGFTPLAMPLAQSGPVALALGAWYQSAVCVTRGAEAFLSQHVGDLDAAATRRHLEETAAHLLRILAVAPQVVAHDLHPDFHSSRHAACLAEQLGIPSVAVQHHHAHVAAVLAEHGIEEPVLGLALDGVGLGSDGRPWGGELLLVDGARAERIGRLRPLPLPGGDAVAREPWRMAASVLSMLGRTDEIRRRFAAEPAAGAVAAMLEAGLNAPPSSSLGRVFDAAAALLGIARVSRYEGEAAMRLQSLACARARSALDAVPGFVDASGTEAGGKHGEALWLLHRDDAAPAAGEPLLELDLLPLLGRLMREPDAAAGAALFHAVLADALAQWVLAARERLLAARPALATQLPACVAAAGGCLQNALLAGRLRVRLRAAGIELLEARLAPPGDGGLALGQAWVAQRVLEAMP